MQRCEAACEAPLFPGWAPLPTFLDWSPVATERRRLSMHDGWIAFPILGMQPPRPVTLLIERPLVDRIGPEEETPGWDLRSICIEKMENSHQSLRARISDLCLFGLFSFNGFYLLSYRLQVRRYTGTQVHLGRCCCLADHVSQAGFNHFVHAC